MRLAPSEKPGQGGSVSLVESWNPVGLLPLICCHYWAFYSTVAAVKGETINVFDWKAKTVAQEERLVFLALLLDFLFLDKP